MAAFLRQARFLMQEMMHLQAPARGVSFHHRFLDCAVNPGQMENQASSGTIPRHGQIVPFCPCEVAESNTEIHSRTGNHVELYS